MSPSSHPPTNLIPAVIQRVKSASVTVDGQLISTIGKGLLVLAAVEKNDTQKEAEAMASKILKVKFWDDDKGGRWKKSVRDIDAEVLCGMSYYPSHALSHMSPQSHLV